MSETKFTPGPWAVSKYYNLIAAAPDMYKALKGLTDAVMREGLDRTEAETNGGREETRADNFIKLMDALNASRSAIDKAEGKGV